MKDLNIKQILAVFLAAVMLLSNIPVAAFAQEQTYCGLDHEHVEACYIDPDGETPTDPEETDPEETDPEETDPEETEPEETDPEETEPEETDPEETDPEETDPEETEPEVTEPEVTEPEVTEPEVTEPEVTEPEVTEPEVTEPEKSLYEKLMAAGTVQELCDLLAGDKTGAAALTAAELAAVKSRVESLYGKLEAPAEAEKAAYEQIIRTVTELEAALQNEEDDDPTEPEVTEPEVTEPEETEPEETEPEVTEPEVTEPEVTEPEVTEPEVTEPEVTEPEVTEPEATFFQQLLDCQSAEQMYLLVLEDMQKNNAAKLMALTTAELTSLMILAQNFPKDAEGVSDRADLLDTLALFGGEDILGDIEILPEIPDGYIDLNAHYAGKNGHAIGSKDVSLRYILTDDLQLTVNNTLPEKGNLVLPNEADVVIDLNGHTLKGNGLASVITTRGGTGNSLTIKDSSAEKTGAITGGVAGSGGGIYAEIPVIIEGGNIYGNTATGKGGGIYCSNTLTINAGKIYENSAANGGGIYCSKTLTINAGKIYENSAANGGGIYAEIPVIIEDGNIYGNTATGDGGGIYCSNTLTINAGKIYGNSAANGGGVYATNLVMSGGVIGDDTATITWSDGTTTRYPQIPSAKPYIRINGITAPNKNTASGSGGGVYCSKLTLNGGAVVGNYASSHGGGIYSSNNSEIKNQSIIYGNEAGSHGGGFRLSSGTTTIENGTLACNIAHNYGGGIDTLGSVNLNSGADIIYNTADNNGGGITVEGPGYCKVEGGKISYNYANSSGGGFRCVGTLDLIKGEVNYNRGNNGGGISARTDKPREEGGSRIATVSLEGGAISHNAATFSGGGIHIEIHNTDKEITVKADGTEISYNTAGSSGGGIYASAQKGTMYVDLSNGTLSNNTAQHGGGICMSVGANVGGGITVSGTDVSENTASAAGGGVYLAGGTFTLNGDTAVIQKNTAVNGGGVYLTGGQPNLLHGAMLNNEASGDGGGIYINQQNVKLAPTGDVAVTGNKAGRGAGIFIGGTNGTNASFSADKNAAGKVEITDNTATGEGGGVCISNGYFELDAENITLQRNQAASGGAVAVLSGNFTMSGGKIDENTADNGGAVYVNGGNVKLSAGEVCTNTANVNGGGIAVNNGAVYMSGGSVSGNKASSGAGGGIYVSSTETNAVTVKVYSGTLNGNAAATSGGAVAVKGESGTITVQTGVNKNHGSLPFSHEEAEGTYTHASCPVITSNSSGSSGGAFYISGNSETRLNIFCLEDEGNTAGGDMNPLNEHMSTFLMVEGGVVYLSTSTRYDDIAGTPNLTPGGDDASGKLSVSGTIHVISGVLELFGSKDNPRLEGALTIDLQSSDDRYIDHRGSESKVTVSYHENFYRPDGTPDSAQTAFDIQNGMTHQIYGGLYAHEGYKLYGWNTKKDANPSTETEGWYNAQDVYIFHVAGNGHADGTREGSDHYGNLTLYAIWKSNGYDVKYVSGVPEDHEWSGADKTETRTYDVPFNLPTNWFVWPGHVFDGWKLPDGTVKQVGDPVKNLTSENAATVTVTATWKDCNHPTCVVTSDGENTLTRTCTVCGYSATAKLTAQDAVYDGARHEATLECSDAAFWEDASGNALRVNYAGKTIRPQNVEGTWNPTTITQDRLCIGAGEYTASISSGGVTLTVAYTIHKAEQNAPAERPTYVQPESGGTELKINQISTRNSPQSEAHVQYIVRYVDGGEEVDSKVAIPEGADPDQLSFDLPASLKIYSVLAYYPETDDYLASNLVSAELSFLFAGKLQLKVNAQEGIDFWLGETDKELMLFVKVQSGYYVTGGDFEFIREVTAPADSLYNPNNLVISKAGAQIAHGYTMSVVPEPTEMTEITVYIQGVKKIATVTGYAKEKQHFSDFSGSDSITISRDSAFTMRFDIDNYDAGDYQDPVLTFSQDLPANTTIILRDRGDESYWYSVINAATKTVELSDFMPMSSGGTRYVAHTGSMDLQFVVDFSRNAEISAGSMHCALSAAKKNPGSNTPNLSSEALAIELADFWLSLGNVSGEGTLTNEISIKAGAGGEASKYDHRDMALVVTPKAGTDLPTDASLRMTLNGAYTTWRPDSDGTFFISLGAFRYLDTDITLELNSGMFPLQSVKYELDAALYLSNTDAEAAPQKGDQKASVTLKFGSNKQKTGIKIEVENDKRLFATTDDIAAVVTVEPVLYGVLYDVVVELHQEFNGNTFGDTTIKPVFDSSTNTYTFDLADRPTGDYCIVASLHTKKTGYTVNEARYYFIIHPTEEAGTNP